MTNTATPEVAAYVPHITTSGTSKNLQIQWLRALAAVMVMVFHASVYQPTGTLSVFDDRFGVLGVALFFVISGYLMAVAIARQNPFVFLAHRIVRIYPIFFLVCALYYAATWLIKPFVPVDWHSLSLAPVVETNYPLTVEWSLVFEVTFYVALFLIGVIGLGRHVLWVAGIWLIYLSGVSWHPVENPFVLDKILFVAGDAAMAGGLLVPALLRLKIPPALLIAIGFLTFLPIFGFLPASYDVYRWVSGVSAVMIVTGAIRLSQQRPLLGDNRAGRALARFGDYSYALYLCHAPIIRLLDAHFPATMIVWLGGVGGAILLSLVLGRVDIWLYGHLKRVVNALTPMVRRLAVLAFLSLFFWLSVSAAYALYDSACTQAFANAVAPQLAGKILTPEDVQDAMLAAGFTPSSSIIAAVDMVVWKEDTLKIQGWAVDPGKHANPVALAVFQDGALLDVKAAAIDRADIKDHFHTILLTGFDLEAKAVCRPDRPIVLIAFTAAKSFALLPLSRSFSACPK